jgi:hypothetical protein
MTCRTTPPLAVATFNTSGDPPPAAGHVNVYVVSAVSNCGRCTWNDVPFDSPNRDVEMSGVCPP